MQRIMKRTHICTYCRPVSQFWRKNSTQLNSEFHFQFNCVGRLDRAVLYSCSLRTISERAAQQHHHGLPGASSQAPCSVILAESVLFYFHNVNPTEIYSRLHGRPASRQPAAGQTQRLTGLCVQFSSITAGLCAVLSPDSDSLQCF